MTRQEALIKAAREIPLPDGYWWYTQSPTSTMLFRVAKGDWVLQICDHALTLGLQGIPEIRRLYNEILDLANKLEKEEMEPEENQDKLMPEIQFLEEVKWLCSEMRAVSSNSFACGTACLIKSETVKRIQKLDRRNSERRTQERRK